MADTTRTGSARKDRDAGKKVEQIVVEVEPNARCRCKHRFRDHKDGLMCRLTGCKCIRFHASKLRASQG